MGVDTDNGLSMFFNRCCTNPYEYEASTDLFNMATFITGISPKLRWALRFVIKKVLIEDDKVLIIFEFPLLLWLADPALCGLKSTASTGLRTTDPPLPTGLTKLQGNGGFIEGLQYWLRWH